MFQSVLLAFGAATHVVGALIIFAAAAIPLWLIRLPKPHWVAAALAIGFYWGRETRDHERRLRMPSIDVWHYSWMPWEWSDKGMMDLAWAVLAVAAVVILIEAVSWRLGRRGA
jgi:hypothetical protein